MSLNNVKAKIYKNTRGPTVAKSHADSIGIILAKFWCLQWKKQYEANSLPKASADLFLWTAF